MPRDIKIGDKVRWCDNPYIVVDIIGKEVLLKQRFSIGTILKPILISEVIRDLYKKNNQPEPSYSERQMFQSAIERLARELAAVEKIDHFSATEKVQIFPQSCNL